MLLKQINAQKPSDFDKRGRGDFGLMSFFDCTVVGDVFVDVTIKVKHGQMQFHRGGTSYVNFAKAVLGGSGNVAVGLSVLGGKAAFIGKAGNDFFGKLYKQDLKKKRVIPRIFFDEDSPTGLLVALVEDGRQRSFLVFRGANDKLTPDDICKEIDLLQKSKYLYFSGYSLVNDPQRSAVLKAVEVARNFNAKIVFDPGAHNIIKSRRDLIFKLLELSDIFSLNLEEAQAITNATKINNIIGQLRDKVPLTALKCGEKGAILISRKDVVKVPRFEVEVLDPTGAGDAFTAALIYGLAYELPLEFTGKFANWFASEVVKHMGSRSFPSKTSIDLFRARVKDNLLDYS